MQFDHDWPLADAEFRKAIDLNANNEPAYSFYGLLLIALERFDEAKEVFRQAILRDPAAYHTRHLAWAELESGNYDAAIGYQLEEVKREPNNGHARVFLALFYLYAGRRAEALEHAKAPLKDPRPMTRFDYALVNALVGRRKAAEDALRDAKAGTFGAYISGTDLAMLHAALGERETALDLLEKDTRQGDATLWLYYRGVFFDSIRDDPRFVRLLEEMHLPTSRPRRGTPSLAGGSRFQAVETYPPTGTLISQPRFCSREGPRPARGDADGRDEAPQGAGSSRLGLLPGPRKKEPKYRRAII